MEHEPGAAAAARSGLVLLVCIVLCVHARPNPELLVPSLLRSALLVAVCCAGGSVCCLLCGGLRDEDQYLLRHSSPALDHDSPCGQHMMLVHLEHQDKEQLQRTLARLENENRCVSRGDRGRGGVRCLVGSFSHTVNHLDVHQQTAHSQTLFFTVQL